jgi:hypothetical protein
MITARGHGSSVPPLLLAGYSSVSHFCAEFGQALGFAVLLCEPREEVLAGLKLANIEAVRSPDFTSACVIRSAVLAAIAAA